MTKQFEMFVHDLTSLILLVEEVDNSELVLSDIRQELVLGDLSK